MLRPHSPGDACSVQCRLYLTGGGSGECSEESEFSQFSRYMYMCIHMYAVYIGGKDITWHV